MVGRVAKSVVKPPIIRLSNAQFYREFPNDSNIESNPALFTGTDLKIWPRSQRTEYWAIVGPAGSGKTTFLEILKGKYLCDPPQARSYPYLSEIGLGTKRVWDKRILRNRDVDKAIRYTGFGGKGAKLAGVETRGSYMAARYESRHEAEDFSLKDYLLGNTEANPSDDRKSLTAQRYDNIRLKKVTKTLQLENLLDLPALVLSNGQTRRARIAKAYMEFPLILLLDEPFLGIDPLQRRILSPALWSLSRRSGPGLVLAIGNDEAPPRWITHIICLENCQILFSGPKSEVYKKALAAGYPLATNGMKRSLWRGSGPEEGKAESISEEQNQSNSEDLDGARDIDNIEQDQDPQDTAHIVQLAITPEAKNSRDAEDIASIEETVETEATPQSSAILTEDIMPLEDQSVEAKLVQEGRTAESNTSRLRFVNRWNIQRDIIDSLEIGEPIIQMTGVQVKYGKIIALGNWHEDGQQEPGLHWTIRRGERWGIFGPNGSGKTTVLSLVNSDHPKSYSQSISYFGRSRLPEPGQPGISIFDLQSKIMQASPEVHAFFPKNLSIRASLENAWADTFLSKPKLTHQIDNIVDATLRWFEKELNPKLTGPDPIIVLSRWLSSKRRLPTEVALFRERSIDWADTVRLSDISFSGQRVALFLRAIIKKPDLVILDEAFSGMDEVTRIKCMMFLAYGETKLIGLVNDDGSGNEEKFADYIKHETPFNPADFNVTPFESRQALVVVSHEQEEVPPLVDQYLFLEEPGTRKPPRIGSIPIADDYLINKRTSWWKKMWNISVLVTNKDNYHRSYVKTLRR